MLMKRFLVILAAAGAAISLTGCENLETGGLAIKREGSSLLVAVCEPIQPTDVYMSQRGTAFGDQWSRFWESESPIIALSAGTILSTSLEVPALSEREVKHDPTLAPGRQLNIVLADNSQPSSLSIGLVIPEEGLSDRSWLQQGGVYTDEACPDTESAE